ncbi:hypothetical protein AB0E85_14410 [Streptomyces sp. NPDC029044]|uniref:hypothetical protein n=1 Tax=Streptomyces sp. NPDC029044 TaxID=3157198 RepID=UPI003405E5C2
MNAQRGSTDDPSLADLARRLPAADTGGWTPDGVNSPAEGLGWARGGTADHPVLVTGRPTGDARLRPVGPGSASTC